MRRSEAGPCSNFEFLRFGTYNWLHEDIVLSIQVLLSKAGLKPGSPQLPVEEVPHIQYEGKRAHSLQHSCAKRGA
eukprot:1191504-Prorocentrum_minimum.AAC.5